MYRGPAARGNPCQEYPPESDSSNVEARQLGAAALEQLCYAAESATWRNGRLFAAPPTACVCRQKQQRRRTSLKPLSPLVCGVGELVHEAGLYHAGFPHWWQTRV